MKLEKTLYLIATALCLLTAITLGVGGNSGNLVQISFIVSCISGFLMFWNYYWIRYDEKQRNVLNDWRRKHNQGIS